MADDKEVCGDGAHCTYSVHHLAPETALTQKQLEPSSWYFIGRGAQEDSVGRGFCYKVPGGMQLLGMESGQGNCC